MQPCFTIVTVVYNGQELLEGTIQSVLDQTYTNIEYIIVDGASKDNTLSIIKQYESQLATWISEPDKGLYDAMNKGLQLATGDFVLFLNAGDRLFEKDTLSNIAKTYTPDTDVLYGEVMLVDDDRKHLGTRSQLTTQHLPTTLDWKSLRMGMVVSHQGFLPRLSISPLYLEDNLCADIDWVIKILKKSRKNTNTQVIISEYLTGGLSKKRHQQSLRNRFDVLRSHYGLVPNVIAHVAIISRSVFYKLTGQSKY